MKDRSFRLTSLRQGYSGPPPESSGFRVCDNAVADS
jgi:hypothetical protein